MPETIFIQKSSPFFEKLHFYNDYYTHNRPQQCSIALHPKNRDKNHGNRWGFPYDHNLITSIPHYINASPMIFNEQRYIAAQGPRASTCNDFWLMIWEENSRLIVTVTNEWDLWKDRMEFKFERFWPNTSGQYGDIHVLVTGDEIIQEWHDGRKEKIRKRSFQITHHNEVRKITHLHLENWPDNGVIHPESLCELGNTVNLYKQDSPIVVHCAAGVGRTGTFIAFHSLLQDYLSEKKPVDLSARVYEMRTLRWGAMVASRDQFDLIHQALHLHL